MEKSRFFSVHDYSICLPSVHYHLERIIVCYSVVLSLNAGQDMIIVEQENIVD